jgi:iron complex transport system substrate-binding protein
MENANKNYTQFKAYKTKSVYTFVKKNGSVLYYELAPNRPDLVLKDMLKIAHPELMPDYKMVFYEELK